MRSLIRLYRSDMAATLSLSIPIIVAQLGNVLMGVTDTIMIGRLGVVYLDAAAFANSLFFLVAVVGIGTLSVIAPQVASARGSQDSLTIARLLQAGLRMGLVAGVVLATVIVLLITSLHLFGQPPDVTQLAGPFLLILGLSVVPMMLFLSLKYFADGLSYTRVDMFITLGGLLLNVLLNWGLIYGHLGLPRLGLIGSATATLISRTVMFGAIYLYVFRSRVFKPYRLAVEDKHLGSLLLRIAKQGFPAGMQYFFEVGAFAGAAIMAGWLGVYALASHQIAISLASITYMVASGIAAAGAIRVGEAVGHDSRSGILRAGTTALALSVAFMSVACGLFLLLSGPLVRLYIADPAVIPLAASLVLIAGFFQLSDGVQVVGLGMLRGIADVNIPTLITLVAYWVIGIPLGYGLAFGLGLHVQGIWIGLSVGLTVSAVLLTIRFYHLSRKVRLREMVAEGVNEE